MSARLTQASLLIERSRYQDALELIQFEIAQNPDNSFAHAMLALCHSELEQPDAALKAAKTAIQLAPNNDHHIYILALVQYKQEALDTALATVKSAITLEPRNAQYYALLSGILLDKRQWQNALDAANEGLRIDPEHVRCANLRAMALVKLGKRIEANSTIDFSLSQDPDNPLTHANKGWTSLHQSKPKEAMNHFAEALRLDPNFEWAQAGILEAMKARNPIYRVMLGYFLWMDRLDRRTQWGIILGAYFLFRILNDLADTNPQLEPFINPVLYLYIAFVFLSWTSSTLFDLFLRLDRFGRLALPQERIRNSNWVGITLLIALGLFGAGLMNQNPLRGTLFLGAVQTAVFIIPLSSTLRGNHLKGYNFLRLYTAVLGLLLVLYLFLNIVQGISFSPGLYILGVFVYQFAANVVYSRG
ncbi:MAG: tetratricopeptide repeat protein [Chloroflexota bacterium]